MKTKNTNSLFLLVALFGTTFFAQSMNPLEWPGMDTLEWPELEGPEGGNLSLTPISALEAATGQRGSLAPHPLDCSSCGKSTICLSLEDPNRCLCDDATPQETLVAEPFLAASTAINFPCISCNQSLNRCLCEIDQSLLTTPLMTPAGTDALEHAASLSQPSNAAPDPLFTLFLDGTTTVLTQGALPPQASATAQPLSHPQETQGGYDEEESRNSESEEAHEEATATATTPQLPQPLKIDGLWYCQVEGCGKHYPWRTNVTQHMKTHLEVKPFKCPYCSKAFTRRSVLSEHIRKHTRERPFACPHCSKAFTRKPILSEHIRKQHTGDEQEEQDADALQAPFPTATGEEEQDIQQPPYPENPLSALAAAIGIDRYNSATNFFLLPVPAAAAFPQPLPPQASAAAQPLDQSQETQGGYNEEESRDSESEEAHEEATAATTTPQLPQQKNWHCQVEGCGRSYKNKKDLTCHMKKHTGERTFKCIPCNRYFTGILRLQRHINTHSNLPQAPAAAQPLGQPREAQEVAASVPFFTLQPLECEICRQTFAKICHLVKHRTIEHSATNESLTFCCDVCGKPFKRHDSIKAHKNSPPRQIFQMLLL